MPLKSHKNFHSLSGNVYTTFKYVCSWYLLWVFLPYLLNFAFQMVCTSCISLTFFCFLSFLIFSFFFVGYSVLTVINYSYIAPSLYLFHFTLLADVCKHNPKYVFSSLPLFFFFFVNSVHAVTGECEARGRVCNSIPGSGGKVREPRGIHTGADKTAAVVEAADHPCVAPSASQDQGQSPHPSVSLQIMMMMMMIYACFFVFLVDLTWTTF